MLLWQHLFAGTLNMTTSVGYIGLGNIGAPMAARILSPGGFSLTVWNRTVAKMAPLVAGGATAAVSAADTAAKSDLVFLCLDSADAIEAVVFGPNGVAAGGKGRTRLLVDNFDPSSATDARACRPIAEHDGDWMGRHPGVGGPGRRCRGHAGRDGRWR
jgi:3-hydroxyisobutyrate dehydrogenase-like beta-hydroxyacid dehydrogenase